MDIYCIRHGQTVANVENIKGLSDTVLTKPGIEQAEELVSHLNKEHIYPEIVITSPLVRAVQTAGIIAGQLDVPLEILPGLAARDLGALTGCDGVTFSEWMKKAGYDTRPAGGESLLDLERRVKAELAIIKERFSGHRVLIVIHNGLLRIFDHLFTGISAEEVMRRNYRACLLYRYSI